MGKREERDRDRERERDLRIAARAGAEGGSAEEARTVGFLCGLSPPELIRVLGQVFAEAIPFADEAHISRSRYFLGVAWADRTTPQGEPPEWGKWYVEAAAYHTPRLDQRSHTPALSEEGRCPDCRVILRSNVKIAVCPICGREAYLT